jgi:hypothetical protein
VSSALVMAAFGWLVGRRYDESLIAILSGALLRLLGLRR